MKEKGISLNSNKFDPFVQKYGGAWKVDMTTILAQLDIKLTSGTYYELVPRPGLSITQGTYQNLANQVKLIPFNIYP
jgi:hypothetical protein